VLVGDAIASAPAMISSAPREASPGRDDRRAVLLKDNARVLVLGQLSMFYPSLHASRRLRPARVYHPVDAPRAPPLSCAGGLIARTEIS